MYALPADYEAILKSHNEEHQWRQNKALVINHHVTDKGLMSTQ